MPTRITVSIATIHFIIDGTASILYIEEESKAAFT